MLIIISPAKSLDFKTPAVTGKYSVPEFLNESEKLVSKLKKMSPKQLSGLMGISSELGELNFRRYQSWALPFTPENSKQAIFAFNGDVYQGLNAAQLTEDQVELAQQRLRILSGLYGVLKPLDLIQPYRLEMGTKLKYYKAANLYSFWNPLITKKINQEIKQSGSELLLNLASNEYFKSIDRKKLKAKIVSPEFKDGNNGDYKIISFFAKRARGLMTRFILENNITKVEDLQAFDLERYLFNPGLSKPGCPVFTRDN